MDILTDSRKKVNLFLVTLQTLYEYGSSPTRPVTILHTKPLG